MPFLATAVTAVAGFFGVSVSAATAAAIATQITLTAISVGVSLLARMLKGRPRLDALDGPTHTITSEVVNARFLAGKMRTPGVLCYFGAAGREARMGLVLGEGSCEGLADDGTPERTGKAVIWVDGKRVQLERTTQSGGDLYKPVAGDKYDGKIEIREYFAADGSQGAAMRTAETTELIDNLDYQGDGTEEFDDYGNLRQIEQLQPSPFPPWTEKYKIQGLSWVYVKLTQPNYKDAEGRPQLRQAHLHARSQYRVSHQGNEAALAGAGHPVGKRRGLRGRRFRVERRYRVEMYCRSHFRQRQRTNANEQRRYELGRGHRSESLDRERRRGPLLVGNRAARPFGGLDR